MLNCSVGPCGVEVAVGAVEVGVLAVAVGVVAVAVTVAVRTVVAVTDAVTLGKSPLPQPELGSIVSVKATIVRMGKKRTIPARLPRSGGAPRVSGLLGAAGKVIFRLDSGDVTEARIQPFIR